MDSKVYTGGTFDCFHAGHVQFLEKCSHYGLVTVALNTDEFVQQFKVKKPIMTFPERYECLRGCKFVSEIIANISGEDSKPTICAVKPKFIIVGDDWKTKDYYQQMGFTQEWLVEQGIELIYVPYTKYISTTNIKRRFYA